MDLHNYFSIQAAKGQGEKLANAYRAVQFKNGETRPDIADIFRRKADAVSNCSTVWVGQECAICGRLHAMHTWGCKDRLCPVCSTRRSRVLAAQSHAIMPDIIENGGDGTLVTLTVKNVNGFDLPGTITSMLQGWASITQSYDMRKTVDGWARTMEITYNRQTHQFHPHIHSIILSSDDRWQDTEYWERRWKTAADLDYKPVVDSRAIKPGTGGKAILEVSKYITKTGDLIDHLSAGELAAVIEPLAMSIRSRRLTSYGGDWAAERRRLRLKDPEEMSDTELSEYDADCAKQSIICCGEECRLIMLDWAGLAYDKLYPSDYVNDLKTSNAIFRSRKALEAIKASEAQL